jgi:hypothetical protein
MIEKEVAGRSGASTGAGAQAHIWARPGLSPEIRDLIATMASQNPLWGTERIRVELLNVGIVVSPRSIRRYRDAVIPGHPARVGAPTPVSCRTGRATRYHPAQQATARAFTPPGGRHPQLAAAA